MIIAVRIQVPLDEETFKIVSKRAYKVMIEERRGRLDLGAYCSKIIKKALVKEDEQE